MSGHLSSEVLMRLTDAELAVGEMQPVMEHLRGCPECTTHALEQALLKKSVAAAGRRYALPEGMQERLANVARLRVERPAVERKSVSVWGRAWAGWAVAAMLLAGAGGLGWMQNIAAREQVAQAESAALVAEVSDTHIAALAGNQAPEVVSSDRHTVKPWFQGKLPFTFNLPEGLPEDTRLEGADLVYLRGQPAAQLLYRVGQHRVSVFVQAQKAAASAQVAMLEHAGFHVARFGTRELDVVAVSDVEEARLRDLMERIEQVQAK